MCPQLPWQPAMLEDISASLPSSGLCTGLRSRAGRGGQGCSKEAPLVVGHSCSVDVHRAASRCQRGFPGTLQLACPQHRASQPAGRAHSPAPPRLAHLGCTAPQEGTPPPDPCAALAHPGGILHTASLLPQFDLPPQRDSSPAHQAGPRGRAPYSRLRHESDRSLKTLELDLPAVLLDAQGTTARKGVAKETPGHASVQERLCCESKSSFQPRSTTTAGRYLRGSRLSPSSTPGHWYYSRPYLPDLQHVWTASETALGSQHIFHVNEPD